MQKMKDDMFKNDDIDYDNLFGVEAGDNEAEIADQPEESEDIAEDTETTVTDMPEGEDSISGTGDREPENAEPASDTNSKKVPQTSEENSAYAAARRKAEAERDAAIAKVKAEAQKEIDAAYASTGIINPYTNKPITTKAEYDEYRERFAVEQKKAFKEKAGLSDAEFNQFISDLPEIRAAKEAQVKAEEARAKINIENQLKEISELDPSVKTLEDLAKLDTYPRFYELVKRGNTFVDAYKLANMDTLTQKAAAASRQAVINQSAGKQHLEATSQRGAGAVTVPNEVKEAYRAFNPGATDAEIQKHYNSYMKK